MSKTQILQYDTVAIAATKAAHDLMGRHDYTTAVLIGHKAVQVAGRDDAGALFGEITRLVQETQT